MMPQSVSTTKMVLRQKWCATVNSHDNSMPHSQFSRQKWCPTVFITHLYFITKIMPQSVSTTKMVPRSQFSRQKSCTTVNFQDKIDAPQSCFMTKMVPPSKFSRWNMVLPCQFSPWKLYPKVTFHDKNGSSPVYFHHKNGAHQSSLSCPTVDFQNKMVLQGHISWQEWFLLSLFSPQKWCPAVKLIVPHNQFSIRKWCTHHIPVSRQKWCLPVNFQDKKWYSPVNFHDKNGAPQSSFTTKRVLPQ